MKINKIKIDGFRCLCDFEINFEDRLTLIVGENDSGKSSLIDCLGLFTGIYSLDKEDFNHEKEKIYIELFTEDFIFTKTYVKNEYPNNTSTAKPSEELIRSSKDNLDNWSKSPQDFETEIRELSKKFGQVVRSNSSGGTLITNLKKIFSSEEIILTDYGFPVLNRIQLDGKQFENVEDFFKEVFLRDKQLEIWNAPVEGDKTIQEFIQDKLKEYSTEIERNLESNGIKEKLKQYLKDLTEIKVDPSFEPRSLNISSHVKFLENGREISVDKKGDGTKRRITLALLEYKAECEETCTDDSRLYILDEPDTHLHVKAQLELFGVLDELANKGCQIILTTHSPFLINAIKPKQIRLLYQPDINSTKIKCLKHEPESSDKILRHLGIENIYLYFAKKIVLVEGETEEGFLPRIYEKVYGISLSSDLVKVISTGGIKNIAGFSKALIELIDSNSIHLLKDNDASEETVQLIEKIGIPEGNQVTVGSKEFEDSFSDEVIFNAWKTYVEDCGREIGSNWTISKISKLRKECSEDMTKKFSDELKTLNRGCQKQFTKTIFGKVLGDFCDESTTPPCLMNLLIKLHET